MRRIFFVTALLAFVWAGPVCAQPAKGKVLVVLSGAAHITLRDGVKHPTGFYMNELLVPLEMLMAAGYEPIFATPGGRVPVLDRHSDSPQSFGGDVKRHAAMKAFLDRLKGLRAPLRLSDVAAGRATYQAVFVPGGHAPMQDLLTDPDLGRILRQAHEQKTPTALICHGPIALVSAVDDAVRFTASLARGVTPKGGAWPYRGYRMTIFSTAEEKVAEGAFLGGRVRFYPDRALEAAGGTVVTAPPFQAHVVVDRELITGQNPASDKHLGEAMLKALGAPQGR